LLVRICQNKAGFADRQFSITAVFGSFSFYQIPDAMMPRGNGASSIQKLMKDMILEK
jgi:hypothetical protein